MKIHIEISRDQNPKDIRKPLWGDTFVVGQTNAPRSYDYGYVIELYSAENPLERVVLIPDRHAEYQTLRYKSGMHTWEPVDDNPSIENWIVQKLHERLIPQRHP